MDLRQLFVIGKRWLWLVALGLVLAVGAGVVVSMYQPKVFEAKATLIAGQSLAGLGQDYSQLLASQRLSTTYASVATHRPRLAEVIDELHLDTTPEELSRRVSAVAPIDGTLVILTARASNADDAAATASALAKVLIEASPAIQGQETQFQASIEADLRATQAEVAVTQSQLEDLYALEELTPKQEAERTQLQGDLTTLRSTYASRLSFPSGSSSSLLTISEPAVPPVDAVSPRPPLNVLLGEVPTTPTAEGGCRLHRARRTSATAP